MRLIANDRSVEDFHRSQKPTLVLAPHDQRVSPLVTAAFGTEHPTSKMARSLHESVLAFPAMLRSVAIVGFETSYASSLVAANLAVVSAQTGNETVLVDANFARKSQDALFNAPEKEGFFDLLCGRSEMHRAVLPTAISPLSLLRTGTGRDDPSLILQEEQLRKVLGSLEDRFAMTIVDAGDVDQSAIPVAGATMGVIMVARRNRTLLAKVEQVTARLRGSGTAVLGTLISDQ